MSDLRYPNSKEFYELTPEQEADQADRKRAAETPTARERFMQKHPEWSDVQRSEVTGANKMALLAKVRDFRVENLKAELAKRENDLTESERSFVAEVLGLRIQRKSSVRALIDELHIDSAEDFGLALTDAKELRAMKAKHDGRKGRYPSMPDISVSAQSFIVRGM